MRISIIAIVMALVLSSPLAMAQTDKPADSGATPPAAAPAPAPSAAPAAAAGAPQEGTAMKSAISTPACYVKFLETKVAGKLNGKKWTDYRRDVCGAHETTAVFPTAIAPKYASETDQRAARGSSLYYCPSSLSPAWAFCAPRHVTMILFLHREQEAGSLTLRLSPSLFTHR